MPSETPPPTRPSRFYAAIDAGRMECPACGRLLLWGQPKAGGRALPPDAGEWDPLLSVLRCQGCGTRYQLGVIAWPFKVELGRQIAAARRLPPKDQRADIRQAAELRRLAGGFWPWSITRGSRTAANRYVDVGCTCPSAAAVDPACEVHGDPGPFQEPEEESQS